MGEKVEADGFALSDRQKYRRKLQQCLAVLGRLLAEKRFDRPKNLMGLEIEAQSRGVRRDAADDEWRGARTHRES